MSRTVAAAVLIAASLSIPLLAAQSVGDPRGDATAALWLGLLVQLGWLGFALGGSLLSDDRVADTLGWVRGRLPLLAVVPAVLGFLCASFAVHQLLVAFELRNVGQLAEIDRSVRASQVVSPWLALAVAGLLPGFAEESLFRGFVLRRLRLVAGPFVAVAGSAAVFGIAHFDWIQGSAAVVLGLYLGTLGLVSGSLWPCVVAHATNNLLGVLAIQGAAGQISIPPALSPWLMLAVSAALLGATAAWTRHASPAPGAFPEIGRIGSPGRQDAAGGESSQRADPPTD